LLAFALVPGELVLRIAAGCGIAVTVFGIAMSLFRRPTGNARTQALYRERLGGDGPFTCEVELTPAGVVSRQLGQETRHPWSHVASVSEVTGGIEIDYTPIGSLLVRDRAFPDAQARSRFIELVRSRLRDHLLPEGAPPDDVPAAAIARRATEQPIVTGPREREYFVAWLWFFACVSATGSLLNAGLGAGATAILGTSGAAAVYGLYVFAGLSFAATACLSYLFFRIFARRLVSRVQAHVVVDAA
jgi:hypothetical protein